MVDCPVDLRVLLGLGTANKYAMVRCPFPDHDDSTASFMVCWNHGFCQGCRRWVSWQETARLIGGIDVGSAQGKERVKQAKVDTPPVVEEDKPAPPLADAYADLYQRVLTEGPRAERVAWLADRGLVPDTVERFKLGHDGARFVIPVWDAQGNLVTLRYRLDPDMNTPQALARKYRGLDGRNGWHLYPAWLLATEPPEHATYAIVTEGELDAIRLWQDGWIAATGTNGAGQLHKLPIALKAVCPSVRTLYLAMDQDEAGHLAAQAVRSAAEALGIATVRWRWDGAMKDVTDLLMARPGAIEALMGAGGAVVEPWEEVELWLPDSTPTQPVLMS